MRNDAQQMGVKVNFRQSVPGRNIDRDISLLWRTPYASSNAHAKEAPVPAGSAAALCLEQSGISAAFAGVAAMMVLHRTAAAKKDDGPRAQLIFCAIASFSLDRIRFVREDQARSNRITMPVCFFLRGCCFSIIEHRAVGLNSVSSARF